jgi:hypothetical protein
VDGQWAIFEGGILRNEMGFGGKKKRVLTNFHLCGRCFRGTYSMLKFNVVEIGNSLLLGPSSLLDAYMDKIQEH